MISSDALVGLNIAVCTTAGEQSIVINENNLMASLLTL